jgi:hypothetical protein
VRLFARHRPGTGDFPQTTSPSSSSARSPTMPRPGPQPSARCPVPRHHPRLLGVSHPDYLNSSFRRCDRAGVGVGGRDVSLPGQTLRKKGDLLDGSAKHCSGRISRAATNRRLDPITARSRRQPSETRSVRLGFEIPAGKQSRSTILTILGPIKVITPRPLRPARARLTVSTEMARDRQCHSD